MANIEPGAVILDRFDVEALAAAGGMGTVYRCLDRHTGLPVALKVQPAVAPADFQRFEREALLLAELRHPGVVRYVAHGQLSGNELYLAMEWLEGESLEATHARGPLGLEDARQVAARIAEVLLVIHGRGIIHRDLKPSNLFLPGGRLHDLKLLDFGIAGLRRQGPPLTRTGAILGTPGYMAPEQARGAGDVDARADLFSLGCVLFECLAGRPPFVAEDAMAVLAKILLEEAPPLAELREDAPAALCALVARLCSRAREARPASAGEVLEALCVLHLEETPLGVRRPPAPRPALTGAEQRLLCVALVDRRLEPGEGSRQTLRPGQARSEAATLLAVREVVEAHQGRLDALAGGAFVASWSGAFAARDQSMRAARCALALRALLPGAPIALATGRGVALARSWAGEAIGRAARLLRAGEGEKVLLDEVTARLISERFEIGESPAGPELQRERDLVPSRPTFLGKPTPCIGRDRELGALQGIYSECRSEPVARATLLTGPAGVGKSRLVAELVDRLQAQEDALLVVRGRGDAMRAGSPFGLLASALRGAFGVLAGEPPQARAGTVDACVARVLPPGEAARVSAFLGELLGAQRKSALLEVARGDTQLMGDQLRRAFVDWLLAECSVQPVLLVLEDLHWGDLPTVKFIDAALRELEGQPLLVLGLARPEVHQVFPQLWAERRMEELRLAPLTPKASARLVRAALGEQASAKVVERVVAHGEGNALHLEELIRAAAEQREGPPQTVLVMLQSRLEQLDPEARHVLRAASVFGERCWAGGVAALLGGLLREERVREWLSLLAEQEIIGRMPSSRFPGEEEHGFRHALVRDAAYSMLTEADRALGHRLARDWLERHGESEALVLAEHCERGGEPARAVAFYLRAAEQALEGDDVEAALLRARRALACEPDDSARGPLLLLCAEAHGWRGEHAESARCAAEALGHLPRASSAWFVAAGQAAEALGKLGDHEGLARLAGLFAEGGALGPHEVQASVRAAAQLFFAGKVDEAMALTARVEAARPGLLGDPRALAFVDQGLSVRTIFTGDLGSYRELKASATEGFERAGDRRNACAQWAKLGYASLQLGLHAEAEEELRGALLLAGRLGLHQVSAGARHNLGLALALQGKLAEAEVVERQAIAAFQEQRDRRLELASRGYLARILLLAGRLEEAAAELETAVAQSAPGSPALAHLLAHQAALQLAAGNAPAALARAREAFRLLEQMGGLDEGESVVRLVYAEALHAAGERGAAREVLQRAEERLRARAANIQELRWRETFLSRVPENARTLALALEWAAG